MTAPRQATPPNTAVLDVRAMKGVVCAILDESVADIDRRCRYNDASTFDDDGNHHAKGGIFNDTSGRSADGYTKEDVDDVRRDLRERGLTMDFDGCDAMMNEYIRTGYLSLNITVAGLAGGPKPRRQPLEVTKLSGERYRVASEVVNLNRRPRCSCRPRMCEHEVVARRQRQDKAWAPFADRFEVSDRRKRDLVRTIVKMLLTAPEAPTTEIGRRPYSTRQRVLALVIRELFTGKAFEAAKGASIRAGFFARAFPESSLKTFRKDDAVSQLMSRLARGAHPGLNATPQPLLDLIASAGLAHLSQLRGRRRKAVA